MYNVSNDDRMLFGCDSLYVPLWPFVVLLLLYSVCQFNLGLIGALRYKTIETKR